MNKALLLLLILISLLYGQTTVGLTVNVMPKLELVPVSPLDPKCKVNSSLPLSVRIQYVGSLTSQWLGYPSVTVTINGQNANTDAFGIGSAIFTAGSTPGTYSVDASINTDTYPEFTGRSTVKFNITVEDNDTDEDGILDLNDACPGTPEDKDGIYDDDGCPEIDGDSDGIGDESDNCPTNAEDFDGFEDDDGCPDPVNIQLTVEDNVDGECMEGRNLTFSASFDPTDVVGDSDFNLKFSYTGPDEVTVIEEDWSWDTIEDKSIDMPNVLDGESDHCYTSRIHADLYYDNDVLYSSSRQMNIKVYELWIESVIESSESKSWQAVVGEPFESSAIASKDCNGWVWDMYDNGVWEWVEPVAPNFYGQTSTLQIRTSKLPTAEHWDYFGDAYGTLNAWCMDGDGNILQINSTDQDSNLKIKVFFDPDLINPNTVSGIPTPNCFYYWQEAYFAYERDINYDPQQSYGSTDEINNLIITYGDLSNPKYADQYNHYNFLSIYIPLANPYNRPTADTKSRVDLFYSVINHELRHRYDYSISLATTIDNDIFTKLEYIDSNLDGTGQPSPTVEQSYNGWFNYTGDPWYIPIKDPFNDLLCDLLDYYQGDNNGSWRHSNDFLKHNEYRNWSSNNKAYILYQGDFEYNAREEEWITAPLLLDWSKGGKQW